MDQAADAEQCSFVPLTFSGAGTAEVSWEVPTGDAHRQGMH